MVCFIAVKHSVTQCWLIWENFKQGYFVMFIVFALNISCSGRNYTEKDWVRFKVQHYSLQIHIVSITRRLLRRCTVMLLSETGVHTRRPNSMGNRR